MNNKLKPALLGGLVVGLLSGISQIIPFAGFCCCLWAIGGGILAAYIYVKGSPIPVSMGDGAMVGALAGVVGGIIYLIIGLPIALIVGTAAITEQLSRSGVEIPVSGAIQMVLSGIMGAIFLAVLATLGGIIGVAIFEKRKGTEVPPPPQNF